MKEKRIQVVTGKIRMCYVTLDRPRAVREGQEPKYSMRLLIPKSDVRTLTRIETAVQAAAEQGMNEKWGGRLPEYFKSPLRDGDLEHFESDIYAGHYFINASSKMRPLIVDESKREIESLGEVYSGCYGRAVISFYAYAAPSQSGVGCCLLGVQKLEDGKRLGNAITAEAFDEDDFSFLD